MTWNGSITSSSSREAVLRVYLNFFLILLFKDWQVFHGLFNCKQEQIDSNPSFASYLCFKFKTKQEQALFKRRAAGFQTFDRVSKGFDKVQAVLEEGATQKF